MNEQEKGPLRGTMLSQGFLEALGLPEHTRRFVIYAEVNSPVIVEVEYFPRFDDGDLETIQTEFMMYKPVRSRRVVFINWLAIIAALLLLTVIIGLTTLAIQAL